MLDKKELRKQVLAKRDALTREERREKSVVIAQRVIQHQAFQEADAILLFASFRGEVDTVEILSEAIRTEKKVYFPKVHGDEMQFYQVEKESDFEEGRWGIREPKIEVCKRYEPNLMENVCVIMPGAVFDEIGNRIGYGGGYYDKYLQWLMYKRSCEDGPIRTFVYKMAICFECQMVENGCIEKEEHDVRIDCVVTEDRSIFIKKDIKKDK